MTYKFAHISDTHIGAFGTRKKLADLVLKAFDQAIDICIQEEVNFVIFSGDLFDTNLPDLDIVVKAIHSLNKLRENNIPIYTIAGGHDTSSSHRSILDILIATGLLIRVTTGKYDDNKNLVLEFTIDSKTNAKITGISGRSQSLDKSYYEKLNRKILEDEKGFKIFTFHCFIDVLTPSDYAKVESVPLTWFPKNFQYYAGGHLHKTIHEPSGTFNGYGHFCYPGPLFAASTKDLEENAKKTIRGFFIIDFDEDVKNIKFVKIKPCSYELVKFKADDKTSTKFMDEIVTHVQKIDAPNKIVLLKCTGMLSAGKTSDIDFVKIRKILENNDAIEININRYALKSKEFQANKGFGKSRREIEHSLFKENIDNVASSLKKLKGEEGIKLAEKVLDATKQPKKPNETNDTYSERVSEEFIDIFKIKELLDE